MGTFLISRKIPHIPSNHSRSVNQCSGGDESITTGPQEQSRFQVVVA